MAKQSDFDSQDTAVLNNVQPAVSGDTEARFIQTAIDYFNGCIDVRGNQGFPAEQSLLLVFSESPDTDPGLPVSQACDRIRMTGGNTFCDGAASATENLFHVRQLVSSFADVEDALVFIRDHLKETQTFALLLFGQSRVLVHERGVSIATWVHQPHVIPIQRIDPLQITSKLIGDQLDEFHKDSLQYLPGATARVVWDTREDQPTLLYDAERRVQSALLVHLKGIYKYTCATVDEEIPNNGGRVDVRIIRPNRTLNGRLITMVELKVLYPYKNDNDNELWGLAGIDQAFRYKTTNLDTDEAFACVYDARPDKTNTLPKLQPHADSIGIVLKHHLMETPKPKVPKAAKNVAPNKPKAAAKKSSAHTAKKPKTAKVAPANKGAAS